MVIIDHGNDCYSLMAHLANNPFTPLTSNLSAALLVKVGDSVKKVKSLVISLTIPQEFILQGML